MDHHELLRCEPLRSHSSHCADSADGAGLRHLLENLADCLIVLDPEGRVRMVSRSAWGQFDGAGPDAVIGQPLTTLWPAECRAELARCIDAARAGESGRLTRCQFDGRAEFSWWEVLVTPMHAADAIDGILVSSRDVTASKLLEAELRSHATHLAQITDSVPATIFQWFARTDGSMGFAYLSEKCEELYGRSRAELMADWTAIGIHPDDQQDVMASISAAIANAAPWFNQCRLLLGDGSVRWIRNRSVPTQVDEHGVVFTGVILDITAEVLHAQHKTRQEEKIRLLVENVSDAFIGMDADGVITEWNQQAETLLGWSAQEAIGRQMLELIAPERFHAGHREGFARFLGTGVPTIINKPVELPLLTKSGREVPVEMTVGAVNQGDSYYFATFLRDISERKAFQQQLHFQANHDALTGLANRHGFLTSLEGALARPAASQTPAAVLFIDLDGFKGVNDTFGHPAGDTVLREFGRRLQQTVRSSDVVSRFAGDEFAVLLTHLREPIADALAIAHDILAQACEPVEQLTVHCPISASIGIALFDGAVDASELMARADQAMYVAKRSGKNRVAHWRADGGEVPLDAAGRDMHDFLTGLPNRSALEKHLRRQVQSWQENGRAALLAVIDVDDLNGINHALGYQSGDRVLVTLAERLNGWLQGHAGHAGQGSHSVARIGGDMFMLLLGDLDDAQQGVSLLHALRQYIQLPFRLAGRLIDLSCTVGYSVYPRDAQDAEALFHSADTALRDAKSLGHGSIGEYVHGERPGARSSMLLEQDLRHALERRQLFLEYQPKVDFESGRISGFEALVRWQHPERGLVAPGDFIGLAEATGLIVDIGEWVLTEACRQLRAWLDMRLPAPQPTMAVNLSARQFREPNLVQTVERVLHAYRLPPASLELELTETAAMFDSARTIALTHELRALGVKLSIDDFGTGFSSLSYLKDLAVDKIKIDRSFVTDIAADPRALAVLESIVDTAKRLGMATTAEGVETAAQLELLRDADCTEYQGFLFSRPVAPARCEALLLQLRA